MYIGECKWVTYIFGGTLPLLVENYCFRYNSPVLWGNLLLLLELLRANVALLVKIALFLK